MVENLIVIAMACGIFYGIRTVMKIKYRLSRQAES